ncbi:glycosyltransferase involved in cell wall biosynthesis [Salinibacter ruber]|uniref:glycosyltransferase family 4 protein n=1 Tax=Salinibacter ruber TaxID=146919 RepID=UPI002167DDC4|nr:glycosyltransferase family 4 protein [Salinibacter ruber]MCS3632486.1 glycosyltransferase involved in cell wall biosynthesis [Salinibacter ruber]
MSKIKKMSNASVHEVKIKNGYRSSLWFAWSVYSILRRIEFSDDEKVWVGSWSGNSGLAISFFKYTSTQRISAFSLRRGAQLKKLKMRLHRSNTIKIVKIIWVFIHKIITSTQLKSCDLLVTQTKGGLKEIREDYPNSIPERVAVLPNNINARWITEKRKAAEGMGAHAEGKEFRVSFVGRFEIEKKGVDTLLEAANLLRNNPIIFDLVGEGPDVEEARSYVRDHGLEGSVRFHGWMKNPLRVMKETDLVAVPSRTDPLPNVVLEAFAMDKPVIGSNVDGIAVMLGDSSLLFEPGNAERMASLIRHASMDQDFYERMKKKCQERASRYEFDWGKELEAIFIEERNTKNRGSLRTGGEIEYPFST